MKRSDESETNRGSEAPRRRGRPKKRDPGTGTYPEHAFTPSRATEIESYPLPDFPLAHETRASTIRHASTADKIFFIFVTSRIL